MKKDTEKEFKKTFSLIKNYLNKRDFDKAVSLYAEFNELYEKLETQGKYYEAYNVINNKMLLWFKIKESVSLIRKGNYDIKETLAIIEDEIKKLEGNKIRPFINAYNDLIKLYWIMKGRKDFSFNVERIKNSLIENDMDKSINYFVNLVRVYNLLARYEDYGNMAKLKKVIDTLRYEIAVKRNKSKNKAKEKENVNDIRDKLDKNNYNGAIKLYSNIFNE